MFNPYVLRKYAAFILLAIIGPVSYMMATRLLGMIYGSLAFIAVMILMMFAANILLQNPFTKMLEGKGLLAMDLTSTGVINMFNVQLKEPYIKHNFKGEAGEDQKDSWDRDAIFNITPATANKQTMHEIKLKDGSKRLCLILDHEEYNRSRFSFSHYPVLIWNSINKSFLTKEYLSEKEKEAFAEHQILHLNNQINDLSRHIRDFARSVVDETLKRKKGLSTPVIAGIIVFIILIILGIIFLPNIIGTVGPSLGAATGSIGQAANTGGGAITPN